MDTEKVRVRKARDMWREWVNECMCVGERWWGRGRELRRGEVGWMGTM